jgi:hypothetical protein
MSRQVSVMKHRLINASAGASLLLCVATCALWARSYTTPDSLTLRRGDQYSLTSHRGSLAVITCVTYTVPDNSRPPFPASSRWSLSATWEFTLTADTWMYPSNPPFPGVRIGSWWAPGGGDLGLMAAFTGYQITAPHWIFALLFGCAPVLWLVQRRRRKFRRSHGLCAKCGYDMRATPNRCPECGTAPAN